MTLFQHLFWYFGHPEVYVLALPFFGSSRDLPGVLPQADLRLLDPGVRHDLHRRAVHGGVGSPYVRHRCGLLPFFSFMTFLIAVPTGIKFFNWIGTMWKGS